MATRDNVCKALWALVKCGKVDVAEALVGAYAETSGDSAYPKLSEVPEDRLDDLHTAVLKALSRAGGGQNTNAAAEDAIGGRAW